MNGRDDRPPLITVVVRQLHSERRFTGDGYDWSVCAECRQAWPRATEQAIAQALAIPDLSDDDIIAACRCPDSSYGNRQ